MRKGFGMRFNWWALGIGSIPDSKTLLEEFFLDDFFYPRYDSLDLLALRAGSRAKKKLNEFIQRKVAPKVNFVSAYIERGNEKIDLLDDLPGAKPKTRIMLEKIIDESYAALRKLFEVEPTDEEVKKLKFILGVAACQGYLLSVAEAHFEGVEISKTGFIITRSCYYAINVFIGTLAEGYIDFWEQILKKIPDSERKIRNVLAFTLVSGLYQGLCQT